MHKIVHLFFASRIRKQLRDLTGISLNAFRFAYGNIKPDLTFSMYKTPHTFSRSEKVLKEHILKLFEEPLHISDFSEKLGIVMHYLCDYFCFAHSDTYNRGLVAHALYELRMVRSMLYFPSYKSQQALSLDLHVQSLCSAENPVAYLHEHYINYMRSSPSLRNDLCIALQISQSFCLDAIARWAVLCFEPIESEIGWEKADAAAF